MTAKMTPARGTRRSARPAPTRPEALERRVLLSGAVSFGAPITSDVGNDPGVSVGDLNADGKPDLLVADATGTTIRVMLGDGSGHFANPAVYDVGESANYLTLGDFNNDRQPDLVLAHWFGNTVSLMLGDGRGGLGPARSFAAGETPKGIETADFNHDGNLDLVTPGWFAGGVHVLLGDGNGGFAGPVIYPAGSNTQVLVVRDFNGDAHPDVAVTNWGDGTISVMTNDGAAHFTRADYAAGDMPITMFAGDFNGDHKVDLAVGGDTSLGARERAVRLLLGDGAGHFAAPVRVPTAELSGFTVADFDGDGNSDLAVRSGTPGEPVGVLLGDGRGGFAAPIEVAAPDTSLILSADLNGDGRPDLGTFNAANDGSPLSVLLNTTPPAPGGRPLVVQGTSGNDRIAVTRSADGKRLTVRVNGATTTTVAAAGVSRIVLRGLAGNDTLDVANNIALPAAIEGGAGSDTLKGGGGDDTLDGGDGNDVLDGRKGADVFWGGTGIDAADYASRTKNVSVGPGKIADDGEAGEGDNVRADVEDVYGGKGDDYLNGSAADNRLFGGPGNDVLIGGGGRDTLAGGAGNDRLFCRDAVKDTWIDGGAGTDTAQLDPVDRTVGVEQAGTGDDVTPPRVVGVSVQEGAVLPAGDLVVTVRFGESMRVANLDRSDVFLDSVFRDGRVADSVSFDPTGTALTARWSGLKDDYRQLDLSSGDGAFEDLAGLDLDGEPTAFPVPPNVSGDGVAGGVFFVNFALDAAGPVPLGEVPPGGGSVPIDSVIATSNDADSFSIDLRAGQMVVVNLTPKADGVTFALTLVVELRDASGAVLASARAAAMSQDVALPAFRVPAAGTYSIVVRAAPGEIGLFGGSVTVGAADTK